MDQKKTGAFLKELRKEKKLTQEQLAEILQVSNRTVSRWENGANLPDLDLLIQIADYYEVELGELLDGERREQVVDKELENTVRKVADYSNEEKKKLARRMCVLMVAGVAAFTAYLVLDAMGITEHAVWGKVADTALGFAYGIMLVGVLYISGYLRKWKAVERRLMKNLS